MENTLTFDRHANATYEWMDLVHDAIYYAEMKSDTFYPPLNALYGLYDGFYYRDEIMGECNRLMQQNRTEYLGYIQALQDLIEMTDQFNFHESVV